MKIISTEKIVTLEKAGKEGLSQHYNGFKTFLAQHSIVPLALGIIIGQTTKDVVNALVEGLITPLLTLLLSPIMTEDALQNFEFVVGNSHFQVGRFVSSFIEMLIIMLIIYITVGVLLKNMNVIGIKTEEKETVTTTKESKKINKKKSNKSTKKA
jgi:large conductance mechanosensitive channel